MTKKDAMVSAEDLLKGLEPKGFKRLKLLRGNTYKDQSCAIVMPTRGMIHHRVVSNFMCLVGPQNQRRSMIIVCGDEVGEAYNNAIRNILACPEQSKYKYLMTIEDDNLVPRTALLMLLESLETLNFDAVSGLYFAKGDFGFPMAFGSPERYRSTGEFEFWIRDVRAAVSKGEVMEVNGIAMGCALWRMDLFREFPYPWFKTLTLFTGEDGDTVHTNTQDLYFCEKIRKAGRRLALDTRVHVGHLSADSGEVW